MPSFALRRFILCPIRARPSFFYAKILSWNQHFLKSRGTNPLPSPVVMTKNSRQEVGPRKKGLHPPLFVRDDCLGMKVFQTLPSLRSLPLRGAHAAVHMRARVARVAGLEVPHCLRPSHAASSCFATYRSPDPRPLPWSTSRRCGMIQPPRVRFVRGRPQKTGLLHAMPEDRWHMLEQRLGKWGTLGAGLLLMLSKWKTVFAVCSFFRSLPPSLPPSPLFIPVISLCLPLL